MSVIRTHVASSFRVVEQDADRLVLQANWLNYFGGASVFIFFGMILLFTGSTFDNRVSALAVGTLGVAVCAGGLVAIAIGLSGSRRRILFDRTTKEVRREPSSQEPARLPFREIAKVEQRVLDMRDMRDSDSTLIYYCLYLVTTKGDDIEVCKSRDESVIAELAAKIRTLIGGPGAGGPSYDGKPLTYWIKVLQEPGTPASPDWEGAPTALRSMREAAVPAVVEVLSHTDAAVRLRAAGALLWMNPKPKAAVPALMKALTDPDKWVRHFAAQVLGDIGPDAKGAVQALIEALGDPEMEVRHPVALALGAIGPAARDAIPALTKALQADHASLQEWAADALKKIEGSV